MDFPLRPWSDLDVMLRELCGSSTAHDACAHEPNASTIPSKFDFEVVRFDDGQSVDIYCSLTNKCTFIKLEKV